MIATSTTYLVLLETAGFKFRCTGITDNPAKSFNSPCPCVFKDEATNKSFKLDPKTHELVEVGEAFGVVCGYVAFYYSTKRLAALAALRDNGRCLKPCLKPLAQILNAL